MDFQAHQGKLVCQDPKVKEVFVAYVVLLVLLEPVYLDLLDPMESQDQWASLDSQGLQA